MSTSPKAKTRGPVTQALRILYLSFALGVGSFIVSAPVTWRLSLATFEWLDTAPGWLALIISLLITNVGALIIGPAIAWGAGALLSARPAVVGFGMAASRLLIVYSIDAISGTNEFIDPVFQAVQYLTVLAASTLLCAWAFSRGMKRSEAREAARVRELQASAAIANLQFAPAEAAPVSPAPVAPSEVAPADALADAAAAVAPVEAAQPESATQPASAPADALASAAEPAPTKEPGTGAS